MMSQLIMLTVIMEEIQSDQRKSEREREREREREKTKRDLETTEEHIQQKLDMGELRRADKAEENRRIDIAAAVDRDQKVEKKTRRTNSTRTRHGRTQKSR